MLTLKRPACNHTHKTVTINGQSKHTARQLQSRKHALPALLPCCCCCCLTTPDLQLAMKPRVCTARRTTRFSSRSPARRWKLHSHCCHCRGTQPDSQPQPLQLPLRLLCCAMRLFMPPSWPHALQPVHCAGSNEHTPMQHVSCWG